LFAVPQIKLAHPHVSDTRQMAIAFFSHSATYNNNNILDVHRSAPRQFPFAESEEKRDTQTNTGPQKSLKK
jgi:hypothetical protein